MSAEEATTSCYRWSCDFVVAHAIFASGFVTAPVAVLHLVKRPHSGRALFFAVFAVFCTTVSLVLCVRFYAELKRPPCWPWQQQQDAAAGGDDDDESTTTTRDEVSHGIWRPEPPPATVRVEMQAALAAGRVPSYEHREDAADCAVCLGDVEKGETVRRMPACRHVFHRECIDVWLHAHATCPVCRRAVLSAPPEPETERPPEVVVTIDDGVN
ncbi:hypothetical protein PR202_gb06726 [Eleusine coracana subsp. coracana]|uniref:RING-type E3 ubiquitin transferase n=1 Tax=Eleusine coracana subsp. coracana TaxID=191504 RepID=A0AAV5EA47_ELECO|nr:hypothetical protein QOZ80_2BG0161320 [Eleusine coracana subsp. coracana]GJN19447.1 hypothetical protein PR202_gb06726 [Eleusine coracana subsp. coracana]